LIPDDVFLSGASIQPEFGRQRKLSSRLGDEEEEEEEEDEEEQAVSVRASPTMIIQIDGVRVIAFVPRLR
jgi:hypothetical protein